MLVQRSLTEHDYVIQALPPNRANDALHRGALPRRAWSRKDFIDSHGFHMLPKLTTENAVPVAQQVSRKLLKGESLQKSMDTMVLT